MRAFLLGSSLALLVSACGGSSLGSSRDGAAPADAATDTDGAGAAPADVGPDTNGCPPALASAAELASTPRADVNLELLALKLSPGKLVAPQATYERVVRDVGAIRARGPELAAISFFPYADGKTLTLTVPAATADQMEAGTYHAWDCLNESYGAATPFEYIRIGKTPPDVFVYLKVRGTYAMELLAAEYAKLPDVSSADGNAVGGDGPTICATAEGSTWHYVFDAASGDCPAGCIDHVFRHFTTTPAGVVTEAETWSTKSGTPRPSWVTELAAPARCH
jgi:hypothetical protein